MTHPHTHDPESERPDPFQPLIDPSSTFNLSERLRLTSMGAHPSMHAGLVRPAAGGRESSLSQGAWVAAALLSAAAFPAQGEALVHSLCAYPMRPEALQSWRRRTQRLVADLEAAERSSNSMKSTLQTAGEDLLADLLLRPVDSWPSALNLTRWSTSLMESEESRLLEGFAALLGGDGAAALSIFSEMPAMDAGQKHASLADEGMAYAYILLGDWHQAQGHMERSAESPHSRVSALAWSLGLALLGEDKRVIEHAAARLDMLVAATSTEFAACLARLRASRIRFGNSKDSAFGTSRFVSIRVTEWARENRSSSGRVARAMG